MKGDSRMNQELNAEVWVCPKPGCGYPNHIDDGDCRICLTSKPEQFGPRHEHEAIVLFDSAGLNDAMPTNWEWCRKCGAIRKRADNYTWEWPSGVLL